MIIEMTEAQSEAAHKEWRANGSPMGATFGQIIFRPTVKAHFSYAVFTPEEAKEIERVIKKIKAKRHSKGR